MNRLYGQSIPDPGGTISNWPDKFEAAWPNSDSNPLVVLSAQMNVNYKVDFINPADLVRIELWYSIGTEGSWQLYDYDEDISSPARFVAPAEGIYRLLIVAVDKWGRRSCPEKSFGMKYKAMAIPENTPPHLTVFVDYTPPVLYLLYPCGDIENHLSRQLAIKWAGFDSFLDPQPVRLYYRKLDRETWTAISGPQENKGEFLWQMPERLTGSIAIKATITDRAGHTSSQYSGTIQLSRKLSLDELAGVPSSPGRSESKTALNNQIRSDLLAQLPGSKILNITEDSSSAEKSTWFFQRGLLFTQRREWTSAARAFEQSLQFDPQCVSSWVNLANVMFSLGDFDRAREHYLQALEINPYQQTALFGLAKTQIILKQYNQAQQSLAKLLEQDRKDWQVWLMHGDVAAQLGNRTEALSSWQQAAADASPIKNLAQQKIDRYKP
ncbi:MAG: tetratricopeptide repeat protein [Sedimentisphaerales bacterium]|nr:tetratricopeptide repeat protein [Sedimentisphaerales bacterium]